MTQENEKSPSETPISERDAAIIAASFDRDPLAQVMLGLTAIESRDLPVPAGVIKVTPSDLLDTTSST